MAAAKKEMESVNQKLAGPEPLPETLRVIYISDLIMSKAEMPGEIYNIVHIAAKFNRSHGIGGFFTACKDLMICVQMFEGPYKTTNELWQRIQADPRHNVRDNFMISHPEETLGKWGMPLIRPEVLLKNLRKLDIDASELIKDVLSAKKPAQDTTKIEKKLVEKYHADAAKDESEKPLTQAKLRAKLNKQLEILEAAKKKSDAALKDEPLTKGHKEDLDKGYAVLQNMLAE